MGSMSIWWAYCSALRTFAWSFSTIRDTLQVYKLRIHPLMEAFCGDFVVPANFHAPHLTEEQVEAALLAAFNQQIANREAIFAAHEEALRVLTDTSTLDTEAAALTEECEVVMELTRKAVQENAQVAQDQAAYQERHNALVARYEAAHARLGEIETARTESRAKRANINRFLQILKKQDALVTEFDEELWYITVDRVMVFPDGRLHVVFRDECEVEVSVPQRARVNECERQFTLMQGIIKRYMAGREHRPQNPRVSPFR